MKRMRTLPRWLLVAAVVWWISGCGGGGLPQEELDQARDSVQAALDVWKKGDRPESLRSRPTPIQFSDDDWQRGARLLDYEVLKTYDPKDGASRCAVKLTVQAGEGRKFVREVVYQVNTKPNLVISRDPMS